MTWCHQANDRTTHHVTCLHQTKGLTKCRGVRDVERGNRKNGLLFNTAPPASPKPKVKSKDANRQRLERHDHDVQIETVGDQARARELRSTSEAHLTIATLTRAQIICHRRRSRVEYCIVIQCLLFTRAHLFNESDPTLALEKMCMATRTSTTHHHEIVFQSTHSAHEHKCTEAA